jgi:7-cyano-7-deazaguanine synthase
MSKAVVLLSGGMDSAVALFQAITDQNGAVEAVSIAYGSTHQAEELAAAKWLADRHCSEHHVIQLPPFLGLQSGVLTDASKEMPHATYQKLMETEGPSPTVVPFRNAVLLSVAVAIAADRGMDYVYAGMHATDAHNWAYPDCTPEFLGSFAAAVHIGTYFKVRFRFPLIWMTKTQVAARGARLKVPFENTWSCYRPVRYPGPESLHCGQCPTCVERQQAFLEAGLKDPTVYAEPRKVFDVNA